MYIDCMLLNYGASGDAYAWYGVWQADQDCTTFVQIFRILTSLEQRGIQNINSEEHWGNVAAVRLLRMSRVL